VCIFKTPRFVSPPTKTLAQCLRIANTAASLGTRASLLKPTAPPAATEPQLRAESRPCFNALLLKNPRFGLTIDELDGALAKDFAATSRNGSPALNFTTSFLTSSEEVLIKAAPVFNLITANTTTTTTTTAPAPAIPTDNPIPIATGTGTGCSPAISIITPQVIELALAAVRPAVAATVSRLGLASPAVTLCHVENGDIITRREGDGDSGTNAPPGGSSNSSGSSSNDGWNAVASRGGGWKKVARQAQAAAAQQKQTVTLTLGGGSREGRAGGAFVALKRLEALKRAETEREREAEKGRGREQEQETKVDGENEKEKRDQVVEEDWLAAVEREEKEEVGSGARGEMDNEANHVSAADQDEQGKRQEMEEEEHEEEQEDEPKEDSLEQVETEVASPMAALEV
jgi:transcriptional repressor NF-X1